MIKANRYQLTFWLATSGLLRKMSS